MAVLKCKMCGGDLVLNSDSTVAECEFCGTKQTVPTADNEKKITLFQRANRLRFACEFDKAAGIYESIVAEFPEEAEAYWGLVLCKYGIEYVDDPATAKKIPTCHRSSFDSVMDDSNFDLVMEYADATARGVYRDEAKQIEELRKSIIEVSSKEEPYDIFICYKETALDGDRTIDSVIAQDVYDALTEKGYRVFFSRITLEDKLGQEYEPYIFAALNSAKIMLAFGTDYEYYNAVWVKNEWSRFLQLIAKGEKKTLIPCYKNIDAYDMPKEFAKLQAQDMGKVGAVQDLLRGIAKILPKNNSVQTTKETVVVQQSASNATVESLLKRVFIFLEDEDFISANDYCEKILDIDPENAQAYFGKVLVEYRLSSQEQLCEMIFDITKSKNFQKALRYADAKYKEVLEEIDTKLHKKLLLFKLNFILKKRLGGMEEKEKHYQLFVDRMNTSYTSQQFDSLASAFETLKGYRDSDELKQRCKDKAVALNQEEKYEKAKNLMNNNTAMSYKKAAVVFGEIIDYKDSRQLREYCLNESEQTFYVEKYTEANRLMSEGTMSSLESATDIFGEIIDYKDSSALQKECLQKLNEKTKKCIKILQKCIGAGSAQTVALKSNWTVLIDGEVDSDVFDSWRDIMAISLGSSMSVGLTFYGTIVAFDSWKGEVENREVNYWSDIIDISAYGEHTVGIKSDGTIVAAGNNDYGQCKVESWNDIIAVSAGLNCTIGLKKDGTVVTVGKNDFGKCGLENWTDIVAISSGENHNVGLKSDGTVVAAGDDKYGQRNVWDWTDIVAISAGKYHTVGLKSDGTVVATGSNEFRQCNVQELTDIVAVSAGYDHTVCLKRDGTLVGVGDNEFGQISDLYKWKLFDNIDDFLNEYERKFNANSLKRLQAVERVEKEKEENTRVQRRAQGVCQHCGGQLKGLFTKKCVNCGKPKDY